MQEEDEQRQIEGQKTQNRAKIFLCSILIPIFEIIYDNIKYLSTLKIVLKTSRNNIEN